MRLTSSRERQPQSQRETQQVCREMGGDPASQSRGGVVAVAGRAEQADRGPRGSCQARGLTYHECLRKVAISPSRCRIHVPPDSSLHPAFTPGSLGSLQRAGLSPVVGENDFSAPCPTWSSLGPSRQL